MEMIQTRAQAVRAPFRPVGIDEMREVESLSLQLAGAHQKENAALALSLLRAADLGAERDRIHLGLCKAFWPGRFENVRGEGRVWLDGAHNPAAARVLVQALRDEERTRNRPIYLLIGMI
jgi:dihydrofolate synthase/folylpolyglutamate synthase